MSEQKDIQLGYSRDELVSRFRKQVGEEVVSVAIGKEQKAGPGSATVYSPLTEVGITPLDAVGRVNGEIEVYSLPEELHEYFLDDEFKPLPGSETGMKLIVEAYAEWKRYRGPLRTVTTAEEFFNRLGPLVSTLIKDHDNLMSGSEKRATDARVA